MSNIPMDLETSFEDEKNRIYGCLFGGWCGDASGTTLEFCSNTITEEMVFKSMNMCGGGILKVGRGQITGDSELEIASIHAIVRKTEECKNIIGCLSSIEFPLEHIANEYINWYLSNPFDVGNTSSNAFRNSRSLKDMLSRAQTLNQTSTENGSLARIAAIGIWSRKLSDNEIMNVGRKEATLSHIHKICQEINGLYCLIIAKLIIGHSPFTVLELVENYTLAQSTISESHYTTSTIKEWFDKSVSLSNIDCRISSGSIKHAFMLVLYFLRESIKRYVSYEEAIKTVLLKGGDTDTNAKIVGNVIGAMVGFNGIPEYIVKPVLEFDCTKEGKIRPEKYSIKRVINLIPYLF
jgi:ADP-ribosylglycohydrolase